MDRKKDTQKEKQKKEERLTFVVTHTARHVGLKRTRLEYFCRCFFLLFLSSLISFFLYFVSFFDLANLTGVVGAHSRTRKKEKSLSLVRYDGLDLTRPIRHFFFKFLSCVFQSVSSLSSCRTSASSRRASKSGSCTLGPRRRTSPHRCCRTRCSSSAR